MSLSKAAEKHSKHRERIDWERKLRKLSGEIASVKAQNRELHDQVSLLEKKQLFRDAISDKIERTKIMKPIACNKVDATGCLVLTDWHVGERIKRSQVNGINRYDLGVCERRVKQIFNESLFALKRSRTKYKVNNLIVALLGDFISGAIHPELLESDILSPTRSTRFAQKLIVYGIRFLLKHAKVDQIIVPCCSGNHGRSTPKIHISTEADNSYEHLMYENLRDIFDSEPRVHFIISDSYHVLTRIHGRDIRFHHGHGMRFGGAAGGPSTAINKAVKNWNEEHGLRSDADIFGHYHRLIWSDSWCLAPSIVGTSAYGIRSQCSKSVVAQAFITLTHKNTITYVEPLYAE